MRRLRDVLRWAAPQWVLLTGLVGALTFAAVMAAGSAEIYEAVVEEEGVAGFDRPVLDVALALRSPGLDAAVTAFTDVGGQVGMTTLATVVALGLALGWRSWTPVALIGVAGAGSVAMTVAGKTVVGRPRPPIADAVPPFESSAAFPSGHALNALVIAGVVAYLLVRKQSSAPARAATVAVAAVFALTMGLTRVYLGHHWLTDVLVAWTVGAAWLTVVVTGHRLFLTLRRRTADAPTRPEGA